MVDVAKGVLEGAWSLLVGWILPVYILMQLALLLVFPALPLEYAQALISMPPTDQQLALLFTAVVIGVVLAAVKTPLYKVLEGYWLWPERIKERGKARHNRTRLAILANAAGGYQKWKAEGSGILTVGRDLGAMRYPTTESEVAPTALGNAIRRFEVYGADRYGIDSQFFHHQLAASIPEYARLAQERARTYVDFAVCTVWICFFAAVGGLYLLLSLAFKAQLALFTALMTATAFLAYRLALLATDEWAATVRLQVDLGRAGVAAAFGMKIPKNLEHERLMWEYINLFARTPRDKSLWLRGDPDNTTEWITLFRSLEENTRQDPLKEQEPAGGRPIWRLISRIHDYQRKRPKTRSGQH